MVCVFRNTQSVSTLFSFAAKFSKFEIRRNETHASKSVRLDQTESNKTNNGSDLSPAQYRNVCGTQIGRIYWKFCVRLPNVVNEIEKCGENSPKTALPYWQTQNGVDGSGVLESVRYFFSFVFFFL